MLMSGRDSCSPRCRTLQPCESITNEFVISLAVISIREHFHQCLPSIVISFCCAKTRTIFFPLRRKEFGCGTFQTPFSQWAERIVHFFCVIAASCSAVGQFEDTTRIRMRYVWIILPTLLIRAPERCLSCE